MEFLQEKRLKLWFLWTVAVTISDQFLWGRILVLFPSLPYLDYYSPLFYLPILLVLLLSTVPSGVMQWLILRQHIDIPGLPWVGIILLEGIVGFFTQNIGIGGSLAEFFFYTCLPGLIIGPLQWLLLRKHIRRSGWWIAISIAGYMIGAIVIIAINRFFPTAVYDIIPLVTVFYGAFTGAGLVVLLPQSPQEEKLEGNAA